MRADELLMWIDVGKKVTAEAEQNKNGTKIGNWTTHNLVPFN